MDEHRYNTRERGGTHQMSPKKSLISPKISKEKLKSM